MKIEIGPVLYSSNAFLVIEKYWHSSFKSEAVIFDFSQLEWISNCEITFIIGWIRALSFNRTAVSIELQSNRDILSTSTKYKRRKHCLDKLLLDWKILHIIPNDVEIINNGILSKGKEWLTFSEIIPFPLIKYDYLSFDETFDNFYRSECNYLYSSYKGISSQTDIDFMDSDYLNYSILKELFSNVCLHSNLQLSKECSFSIGLNKRYDTFDDTDYISKNRINELFPLAKDFYTENNKYRNINYVEIAFQDFGIGIVNSLKDRYFSESQDSLLKYFDQEEYDLHLAQNEDSRIIHYSLLLFSSRFEVDKRFEIHDYIPRGLFIIQEIVAKHHGYLEILSLLGGIGISYKHGVRKIRFVSKKNGKILFPGTQIKISFPSRETKNIKSNNLIANTLNINKSTIIHNIHFLKLYVEAESSLINSLIGELPTNFNVLLLSTFFQKIQKKIKSIEKGQIITIDLAGVDKNTIEIFNKFTYFITHSPINSTHRVILYNVLLKDLNSTLIFNSSNNIKAKGLKPFPVPVISPDLTVEWLGIKDIEIQCVFTDLWKGDTRKEYQKDYLMKYSRYSSNIILCELVDDQIKLSINLPSFENICEKLKEFISVTIQEEINGNGIQFSSLLNNEHNYNNILIKKENTFFLNPNGTYQAEYLSFNEKLYNRAYSKMLSSYFVFVLSTCNGFDLSKITKILSVTLSSQLLGNEVKNIIERIVDKNIDLIALSNYNSFQNEERFNDIYKNDQVLVVNDIISTGNLTENICQSIERKLATPIGSISIIDLRNNILNEAEYPVVSLTKYYIEKIESKPYKAIIEWINPILNAPISMRKSKSNVIELLAKNEFLDFINESQILVGNIKNNSNYMNYYLDTSELLKRDLKNNFVFIKSLIRKFIEFKKIRVHSELNTLVKGLEIVSNNTDNERSKEVILKAIGQLHKINSPTLLYDYKIDIIFFPFLSEISIIEENLTPFIELRMDGTIPLIFPLPRIMTSRGWRFTFPPKFLNILTSGSKLNILIIDDGSHTGATIMQMIDAVAFLSVKSIDVLSIFGRLEDFQKELLSRIKSIKVKNNVVPLNLFFGIHFNLPVYNSSDSPILIELREIIQLENLFRDKNVDCGHKFSEFLFNLKESLSNSLTPKKAISSKLIYSFILRKRMLEFRDTIGQFDSYRFFAEDIPTNGDFSFLIESDEAIITLLYVLNLEIHLYQLIQRLFSKELISKLRNSVFHLLENPIYILTNDQQIFLLKALFLIDTRSFIKSENLVDLVLLMQKNNYGVDGYRYIIFLLFTCGFKIRPLNDIIAQKSFRSNMLSFAIDLKEKDKTLHDKFRFFHETYRKLRENKEIDNFLPANKYYNVCDYFSKVNSNDKSHEDRLLPNHFNEIEKDILNLIYAQESKGASEIDIARIKYNTSLKTLKENYNEGFVEYENIKDIVFDLMNHSNIDLDFNPSKLYSIILKLEKSINSNIDRISELKTLLLSIKNYKEQLLLYNSKFFRFITDQKSNIQNIWGNCESTILNTPQYVPIKKILPIDYTIKVNSYILKLTFDNLIKSKIQYAVNHNWEIYAKDSEDVIELFIKQYSEFKKDIGDGTGQQSIKSILYNFGTLYKKINDNPYTIKITFSK